MLRRMTPADVEQVCEIHRTSWDANELSVKLGDDYQRIFYSGVVSSPHSFAFVYEHHGEIAGYASGFSDYSAFNAELRSRHFAALGAIAARALLGRRLSPGDFRDLVQDGRKLRRLRHPRHHWGAMAVRNEHKGTPLGRAAVLETVGAVFDELRARGCGGVWGACDDRNVPMKKYLWKLGFREVDAVECSRGTIRVFEKDFVAAEPAGAGQAVA